MAVHDISLAIEPGLPTWPTSEGFRVRRAMRLAAGDPANVSIVEMDVHTGTHVEAPLHFLDGADALETVELDRFVGPARVVEINGPAVTADGLAGLAIPPGTTRLLVKTENSARWAAGWGAFDERFVALTRDAAAWVAGRGIRLIGIDHLSIERYGDGGETHRILMRAGVVILEGLDLHGIDSGEYTLVAAPLRLAGTEAAPARALLIDATP